MKTHFTLTEPAQASAETLFEVFTDYAGYPCFNLAVAKVTLVAKHENGAEFAVDCRTRIAKQVRAFDRHERHKGLVVKRTRERGYSQLA